MRALALISGLTVVAVACGNKSDDAGMADGTPPVPDADDSDDIEAEIVEPPDGDYLADDDGSAPPELNEAALTATINEAIAGSMEVHGGPVVAAYSEALAGMDSGCPTWGVDNGTPFWFDSCTSGTGTTFNGYGYHTEYDGYDDGDIVWNGMALYTVAELETPDGAVFRGAGGAGFMHGVNRDGLDVWSSYVQPGFAYDGAAAEGTWLADALDPEMSWYALRDPSGEGAASILSGAAQVADGPVAAIVFDQVLMIDAAWDSSCPIEPSGSISVLDNEGHWIDLYFHGPKWDGTPTPEDLCDGCGEAWFAGTYLGEACFDFSPLTTWSDYSFAE